MSIIKYIMGMGFAIGLLLFLILIALGAITWPYTVNTWLIYAGKEPQLLWWHGALMGIVPGFGQLAILGAIVTWILMMFII